MEKRNSGGYDFSRIDRLLAETHRMNEEFFRVRPGGLRDLRAEAKQVAAVKDPNFGTEREGAVWADFGP